MDALLTATVPLMWGTGQYLGEFFDLDGIIFWQTPDELVEILSTRLHTAEQQVFEYESRLQAIHCNCEKARPFARQIFDRMADYLVESYCHVCGM